MVGASPEIWCGSEDREGKRYVAIRPIAGTRPRGATPEQDDALGAELLADPKERAEHLMLIDLARNDIGRIVETGSVKVTEQYVIEKYSHVQHLVSHVEGALKPGMNNFDVLRATFPAGTLTGAPKVRAMEIIDELEPVKRGIYGGAVGYLSFAGDMDLAIAIRTAVVKGNMLFVQAAAGIVADSIAENEWKETEVKARAVLRAASSRDGFEVNDESRWRSLHSLSPEGAVSPWGGRRVLTCIDDRQLRQLHLQPRTVFRRARTRRSGRAQRRDNARSDRETRTNAHLHFSRALFAQRSRHFSRIAATICRAHTDSRRMPGTSSNRSGIRRKSGSCKDADAWQGVSGRAQGVRCVCKRAESL